MEAPIQNDMLPYRSSIVVFAAPPPPSSIIACISFDNSYAFIVSFLPRQCYGLLPRSILCFPIIDGARGPLRTLVEKLFHES